MKKIYVDNNATTQMDKEVFKSMLPFFTKKYGNPSSMHAFGGELYHDIEKARTSIASFLKVQSDEIIFTSGGTESNNTAIMSALQIQPNKKHIITTKVEHAATLNFCKHLETIGYKITYLEVDGQGLLDLNALKEGITDDTAIISIMYANNETGVIFPINEIALFAREKNIIFHTDAVQAFGKTPINIDNIDMLSISAHKIHGPKGIGALYVKKGLKFMPFIIGGHQEKNRRGGTENVPAIVGFGKACELLLQDCGRTIKNLRDKLERGLFAKVDNIRINGCTKNRLFNTTNISFAFVEGEAIILKMDEAGIFASSGSACTSASLSASHVLEAMHVPANFIQGSIRFSLSRYTTEDEIDYILKKLPKIIAELRVISPYGH